jgi:hypothetical protein
LQDARRIRISKRHYPQNSGRRIVGPSSAGVGEPGADDFVAPTFPIVKKISAEPFLLAALVGAAMLVLRHGWVISIAVFVVLYSLHAAYCLLTGVLVTGAEISFPQAIVRFLPLLVLGRMTRAIGALDEITYIGQSFGSEWVILRIVDGSDVFCLAQRPSAVF